MRRCGIMLILYAAGGRNVLKKAQGQCDKLEHKFQAEKKRIYGFLYNKVLKCDQRLYVKTYRHQ